LKVEEFKKEVKRILESEINFEGHVDLVVETISDNKQRIILQWIEDCKTGRNRPQPCKNQKKLIAFIYKSNDNKIRGILTKEKNAYFIELFLDKHKYYDRQRKYLGL